MGIRLPGLVRCLGRCAAVRVSLASNEGRAPRDLDLPVLEAEALAPYPRERTLEARFAERFGLTEDRVLVTAGADDGLLRACLATLGPGREAVVATPTFEMIPRYVALAGGSLVRVAWPEGPFPVDRLLASVGPRTEVVFLVTPNNPTGGVIPPDQVARIARACPTALIVLDAAYGELAEADPTDVALGLENVVVLRTLSKAWGLAGLRVGCVLGTPAWIERLAASGNPFPVSVASRAIALERLATGAEDVASYVERIRAEREELTHLVQELGARPALPTQGNFVLVRGLDAERTTREVAERGFALRRFPDDPELADAVRITLPGESTVFAALVDALTAVLPRTLERPS